MPDVWEIVHGLNPNSSADANGDLDSDGYTNIEEYINHIVEYSLGGTYNLINRHSSKYLEILDSSSLNGANVVQNACDGTENQLWTFIAVDTCYYSILNLHSGLAMDVEDSSLADGANIVQNPFNGGNNQLWEVSDLSNGYFKIINKGSAKVLDIEGQVTTDEAQIIQNTSNSNNSQQFTLQVFVDSNTPPEVTITSPIIGSLFSAGDTVTIIAEATDNVSVSLVEFYSNYIKVSEDNTAPYTYSFDSITEGIYIVYAQAYDNKGLAKSSSSINFIVQPPISPGKECFILQESDISFCSVDAGGSVDSNHEGFTGTGFCNTDNALGEGINWIMYVHEKDTFDLGIRYACESGNRPGSFIVDSVVVTANISLPATGAWTSWSEVITEAIIDTGTHNVRLEATTSGGLPNVDFIKFIGKKISAINCHPPIVKVINPVAQSSDFLLYPNPAENSINIILTEHFRLNNLLNIYDITGKRVHSQKLQEGTNYSINVEGFRAGIYFVQIISPQQVITKSLIIKN